MTAGYLFILPSFILILIFSIIPIFMTFYLSFTEYNVIQSPVFIGLRNYMQMIKDPFVSASLINTIIYTAIVVPVQTILAMIIAATIADMFRNSLGDFFKGSLFVPVLSSGILVGTIWSTIYATDGGLINNILGLINIPKVNWLGQTSTALLCICIVSIWKNVGYFMVIYYAGIMSIPKSLYEAAEVDGASKTERFIYITLPSLSPVTYLIVTLGVIWSFQVFDIVYVMTGGGPGMSTNTLVLTIYNSGFKNYNMGYASAIAFLLFFIVIIVTLLQKKLIKNGD